ncbi:hypothetical protein [uncultured Corynebacterium sp.]|uniref:phage tail protein n=1 Tax=uncultured Corynebacterium sp. TaxID=159447 RepID=UPI0025E52B17|nr:hypothetical protein [uncultured Corynebacterium sp.]
MPSMNLASAYITIMPDTSKLADGIKKSLSGLDADGRDAGKKLGDGMSKALKGKGKDAGGDLGKEITDAMERSVKGGATNVGKILEDEAEKAGKSFSKRLSSAMGKAGSSVVDFSNKFKVHAGVALGGLTALAKGATDYAAEAEQSYGAVESIFGEHAAKINDLSKTAADSVGLSGREYREQASYMGAMLKNLGTPMDELGGKSADLVAMGADLAATFGGPTSDAVSALGAVLRGETDPIERYGISIKQADIKAKMAEMGLEGLSGEAEKQAQAQATLALLTEQSASAQGQFARETDTAAHKAQVARAKIDDAKETIGTALLPVVARLTDMMAKVAEQVGKHPRLFLALAGAVAAVSAAIVGIATVGTAIQALGGMAKIAKVASKAMTGLKAAMAVFTGPVGLVVAGIAAVVAGLTLFFTKTETGRELWARFTELLGQGWDWVVAKFQSGWESIKAVAGFIKDTFTGLLDFWKTGDTTDLAQTLGLSEDSKLFTIAEGMRNALSSLKDFALEAWDVMRAKWEEFATGFGQFYDTWIAPVQEAFSGLLDDLRGRFSSFGDGLASVWESTVKPVFEFMKSAVQAVVDFMAPIFQTVLVGAFNVFATAVQSVWENIIKPVWGLMRDTFGIIADILTGNFENLGNRFSSMGDHIMGVVTGTLQVAWDVLKAGVSAAIDVAKAVINSFKDAVGRMVSAVKGKIDEMVAGFRAMPGKIKAAFASAGTWLLEAGKNIIRGLAQGVRNAAGMVENAVRAVIPDNIERFVPGLYLGGVVPAFARGGVLPNVPGVSRSERDPILGWSTERKQPIARVEPGEFIVNRDATRKNLPLLAAINGGKLNGKMGDLGLPGFADGGLVGFNDVLKFLRGGTVAGNSTPRSLEGAPYVWGGGLDGNWGDCSGTQSAVAALVAGVDTTGRKFATGTQGGWLSQHGFKRGRGPGKNAFETAYFNGGPWGGHTAGTLFDEKGKSINIEMGGGRGNGQIGGPAAGSRHSQFTSVWWHPLKSGGSLMEDGKIVGTSTDGVTVSNGIQLKTIDWGTASNLASEWEKRNHKEKALRRWSSGVFDTGGILKPGNFAFNASGAPERVLDPAMTRSFDKIATYAPALADGMQRIAGVDWKGLVFELESAWMGQDAGYVELANLMGDRIGERVADKIAFAGAMTRDIQDGSNIRAYLENMSMSEGLDLGDQIGQMLGLDGLKSTLGGVVTSFEDMEDAAVAQVDAAESVKQAEENLAKARAEYREMQGSDAELSVKTQRRISDAEKNLAEARKSGKPDRIAKAEEKLKRTREDAAAELEKNGAKSAEEILKAQEQVTAAEDDLAKAHGAVQMAAQATGQVQIAMMLEVAKLAISIGKKIFELADKINQKITAYETARFQMLGEYAGQVAKLNSLVSEQKAHVVDLADKWVDAVARVDEAIRNTAKAGAGILEAHVKGAKGVADIQKRIADLMKGQSSGGGGGTLDEWLDVHDMGVMWDSHADKLTATTRVKKPGDSGGGTSLADLNSSLKEVAALEIELLAAQIDEQVMVKQAEAALLQAQYDQWQAQVALVRINQDYRKAWDRLLQLQEMQVQFGMSEQQARIAEAINKLHMENAKANAELRDWGNNIGNFFDFDRDGKVFGLFTNVGSMSMQAAQMQIDANNKQIAAYEQLMAKYGGPVGTTPGQEKALDMMSRLIANGKENVAQMAYVGSEFGNATRALNMAELTSNLNKIDDNQLAITRQVEDMSAKLSFMEKMRPLQDQITNLEHERDSLKYLADSHRAETKALRDANLALADYHANQAERARQKQTISISLPGSGQVVDADQVFGMLRQLENGLDGVRFDVNRIQAASKPGAMAVLATRS